MRALKCCTRIRPVRTSHDIQSGALTRRITLEGGNEVPNARGWEEREGGEGEVEGKRGEGERGRVDWYDVGTKRPVADGEQSRRREGGRGRKEEEEEEEGRGGGGGEGGVCLYILLRLYLPGMYVCTHIHPSPPSSLPPVLPSPPLSLSSLSRSPSPLVPSTHAHTLFLLVAVSLTKPNCWSKVQPYRGIPAGRHTHTADNLHCHLTCVPRPARHDPCYMSVSLRCSPGLPSSSQASQGSCYTHT